MLCRRVQVERPSCSTSGGQSGGGMAGEEEGVVDDAEGAVWDLVRAAQEAREVQVRQLWWYIQSGKEKFGWSRMREMGTLRFSIFAQHDAFG